MIRKIGKVNSYPNNAWAPYVFRPVNMSKGDDGWGLEEEVRILIGEGRPMSMV